jgi:multiple sugar transport system permease protein
MASQSQTKARVVPVAKSRRVWTREEVETLIGRIIKWLFIVFFVIITAFPFYWMINLSIRPIGEVLLDPSRLVPSWDNLLNFWEPYQSVLIDYRFLDFIRNSLIISVLTVAMTLVLAVPAAYAITRLDFKLKDVMSWGILLVYMFPSIVIGIPLFVIYSRLGLRGNLPALIVIYLSSTLPVALYMLRSYFQTLPVEMEEAALMDGCDRLSTIWRIVIPLSAPAIASVALYTFMIAWNEILFAMLFLTDTPTAWTLPLGLRQLDSQEVPRTMLMAGSVIITVPVIALFLFFERFMTRGLTAGAVKG